MHLPQYHDEMLQFGVKRMYFLAMENVLINGVCGGETVEQIVARWRQAKPSWFYK
jgi:hypothetical protein